MSIDFNKYLQHQVYLERLATGSINKQTLPSLEEIKKEVSKIIATYGDKVTKKQLSSMVADIRTEILKANDWDGVTDDMLQMALYESSYHTALLDSGLGLTLSTPKNDTVESFVKTSLMSLDSGSRVDSGVWAQFVRGNNDSRVDVINGIVKGGYADGLSSGQIIKRVKDSVDGILTREAEALVRTGFSHYASKAREAMHMANKDVLDYYYYVVTFDNRTTPICINANLKWNNEVYAVGEPAPNPPLHWRCRTTRIAVPKGWKPETEKAAIGGVDTEKAEKKFSKRDAKGKKVKYRGRKDSDTFKAGTIKASTGYNTWLKKQPRWFVDDVLGKKRAELFLDKNQPLGSFYDMTGRQLTLKELAERDKK